jgi:tRNA(fMet)-specific endonuclease VapC
MILDTNAVSALLAGDARLGDLLAETAKLHLPVVVIGEYRFGMLRSREKVSLTHLFDALIRESIVLRLEEKTTEHYAAVREELRRKGRPIPENDVWIAALARQFDLTIISRDQHFAEISSLRALSW